MNLRVLPFFMLALLYVHTTSIAVPLAWLDDAVKAGGRTFRAVDGPIATEVAEQSSRNAGAALTRGAADTARVLEQVVAHSPQVARLGSKAVELEARIPGMVTHLTAQFGDDMTREILKRVPESKLPQLAGYAARADSPATRTLLGRAAIRSEGRVLRKLEGTTILAGGLSAGAIIAATRLPHIPAPSPEGVERWLRWSTIWLFSPMVAWGLGRAILDIRKHQQKLRAQTRP